MLLRLISQTIVYIGSPGLQIFSSSTCLGGFWSCPWKLQLCQQANGPKEWENSLSLLPENQPETQSRWPKGESQSFSGQGWCRRCLSESWICSQTDASPGYYKKNIKNNKEMTSLLEWTLWRFVLVLQAYLKVKMNSINSMQNVATLSIVFMSTTSCLLRAGRKRTSFNTRSNRNVRRTDKPPSDWPIISHTLKSTKIDSLKVDSC